MALPQAEVVEFSENVDFFQIPRSLDEYLSSLGYVWKLVSQSAREAPMRSGMGWRVVLLEDLPPSLHAEVLADFENPSRHYGEIRRGDTRLMIRSAQAQAQWEEIEQNRALRALGQTELAVQEIGEAAASISRGSSVSPLFPGNHSHVVGGRAKASVAVRNNKSLVDKLKAAAEE